MKPKSQRSRESLHPSKKCDDRPIIKSNIRTFRPLSLLRSFFRATRKFPTKVVICYNTLWTHLVPSYATRAMRDKPSLQIFPLERLPDVGQSSVESDEIGMKLASRVMSRQDKNTQTTSENSSQFDRVDCKPARCSGAQRTTFTALFALRIFVKFPLPRCSGMTTTLPFLFDIAI